MKSRKTVKGEDAKAVPEAGKARHGPRSEVTWEGGSGRQPYGNQDEEEAPPGGHEAEAGNRGARSGRNLRQLEQAKRKP